MAVPNGSEGGAHRPADVVHDFTAKLRQPSIWAQLRDYVAWQRDLRKARRERQPEPARPELVPYSINLDLTTACNYHCDHCIDLEILNAKVKHEDEALRAQMSEMAARGLRSVILIGGGEPTLYPGFKSFVQHLKELKLQVAVVSNGSRNDKIMEIAPLLEKGDWVRLSLDAGTNATFVPMHNPSKKSLSLEEICSWVPKIKAVNDAFDFGFSYVITWKGATRAQQAVIENIDEIETATRLARDSQFDYIAFKPFLDRAENGSEVMDPAHIEGHRQRVIARIREQVDRAHALERPGFVVRESTNLRMLFEDSWRDYTDQPQVCHMQALRQVLTPHGTFNCPAYRGVSYARLGEKDAYRDEASVGSTSALTAALLDNFDASERCADVTCLYNQTNWWLEKLIDSDEDLDSIPLSPERHDSFL